MTSSAGQPVDRRPTLASQAARGRRVDPAQRDHWHLCLPRKAMPAQRAEHLASWMRIGWKDWRKHQRIRLHAIRLRNLPHIMRRSHPQQISAAGRKRQRGTVNPICSPFAGSQRRIGQYHQMPHPPRNPRQLPVTRQSFLWWQMVMPVNESRRLLQFPQPPFQHRIIARVRKQPQAGEGLESHVGHAIARA